MNYSASRVSLFYHIAIIRQQNSQIVRFITFFLFWLYQLIVLATRSSINPSTHLHFSTLQCSIRGEFPNSLFISARQSQPNSLFISARQSQVPKLLAQPYDSTRVLAKLAQIYNHPNQSSNNSGTNIYQLESMHHQDRTKYVHPYMTYSIDSVPSDEEYSSSDCADMQVPVQDAANSAIYHRYQQQIEKNHSLHCYENKELNHQDSIDTPTRFRIKNLDTGEEIQIKSEEMEQTMERKLSEGRNSIENFQMRWKDFWTNVNKNNQKLRLYCQEGQYDQAKQLLQAGQANYPVLINHKALDDWSPLHFACYEGQDDIVELLCEHEADVNAVTKFNRNGLHIAVLTGHLSVVKMLFDYKIDADACDIDGNTALHFAAQNGHSQIIDFLLEKGCRLKKNKEGLTPIHDCRDQSLKKIFCQYGFRQNDAYESYMKDNLKRSNKKFISMNKIELGIINSAGITVKDFIFHKKLGQGSFGEVFLCHKKADPQKLFAIKILSKDKVMNKDLKRYALTQRNVMSVINHPFMAKLHYAFQSTAKLFLVMDYYPGGDLAQLIRKRKHITEDQARKYISELILAFEALHKNMIVFRDLKPDNVVLDAEGHCKLTDFGLSKEGIYNNTTGSFCGSVAYLAPEILSKQGHSRTVDWYLLGLLFYELIVGMPPYYNSKKQVLFDNIKRGPLKIPKTMSTEARDLIKKLLCRDPRKRLGAERDSEQLKQHQFFKDVNWQDVFNRRLQMPPIEQPKLDITQKIKVSFQDSSPCKKIEGWTFIGAV